MRNVSFDFREITDSVAFYRQFVAKFGIEMAFGNNLDALWDALTGMIDLPVRVTFHHYSERADRQQFAAIVQLLQEAEAQTEGQFRLRLR